MSKESIERSRKRHEVGDPMLLVTTAALVVSLIIAATVVSIGIARADTLAPIVDGSRGRVALAVLLAIVVAGVSGLTAAAVRDGPHHPPRD